LITKSQALVVIYIKENPYCDIDDIVEDLGVPKNAVSRMLHSLDDDEIIKFEGDMDTYGVHNSQGGMCCESVGWIINQPNDTKVTK